MTRLYALTSHLPVQILVGRRAKLGGRLAEVNPSTNKRCYIRIMGASSIKQTFKILDKILMADEEVEKVVVSKNTSSSFYHRSALIATDKRVLLIEPKYLGLTYQFQDYDWLEVIDIHLKEGIFSAKISLSPLPGSGPALVLGSLKKSDARHFYQYGNERVNEMDDLRRK
ncbi:MAG: PH domain-containing protein, partial [Bacteroidota bacterium]